MKLGDYYEGYYKGYMRYLAPGTAQGYDGDWRNHIDGEGLHRHAARRRQASHLRGRPDRYGRRVRRRDPGGGHRSAGRRRGELLLHRVHRRVLALQVPDEGGWRNRHRGHCRLEAGR